MSIDMKQEIIKRNLKGEVVQACYYALADISQEINAVLQTLTATGNKSENDIKKYARKMSPEDLKFIRKLLDTHSKNLSALAELLPDSGFLQNGQTTTLIYIINHPEYMKMSIRLL